MLSAAANLQIGNSVISTTGHTKSGDCTDLESGALPCSIPGLIEQVLRPPMGGPFLTIYVQLYNAIFFFVFASVLYAVVSPLSVAISCAWPPSKIDMETNLNLVHSH